MSDIFDDIEDEVSDKFYVTEPVIDIISYDDLINKIEYQFTPLVQAPLDHNDYMRWFCINVLKAPAEAIPTNASLYINSDTLEDYENFMDAIEFNIKRTLGITFNDEENRFENVYNIYYFFIVKPEQMILDYLLDHHFYKRGYDFKEVYENNKIKDYSGLAGQSGIDPVQVMSGIKTQYLKINKKNVNQMSYRDRFVSFINYANMIFLDENRFKFYNLFKDCNEFAPCNTYDNLDDQMNVFLNFKYESEELITDWLLKVIMNTDYRETYINEKIITPFFSQIRDFEVTMAASK